MQVVIYCIILYTRIYIGLVDLHTYLDVPHAYQQVQIAGQNILYFGDQFSHIIQTTDDMRVY